MGKKILIAVIAMVIIVGCCVFAYFKLTENVNVEEQNNAVEKKSKEALFTEEDYPRVDASLATQPLVNAFTRDFVGKDIELNYTNTHPGYVKLINGEADLIVVTEPSKEEMELAEEKGVELEVIPVVKEGFVFYVNGENPVDSLTLKQIQDIYSGKITNWSKVGGEDAPIRAFQRPVNSGSQTGMLSLVMKGLDLMDAEKEDMVESMLEIINLVSDYDNGKNSIGYSYYYYATTMYEDIDKEVAEGIKLLGVNGVKPSYETIKDNSYPIQTAYYIVINKDEKEDSNTRKLVDAMLSDRGQNVAKEAGYVPVK